VHSKGSSLTFLHNLSYCTIRNYTLAACHISLHTTKTQVSHTIQRNLQDNKVHYLKLMSLIIKSVSKSVVAFDLQKLLPMMLNALHFNDNLLKETGLDSITAILLEKPELIEPHLSSLVPLTLTHCTSDLNDHSLVQIKFTCVILRLLEQSR